MVLTDVCSDPGHSGRNCRRSPTQGGVALPPPSRSTLPADPCRATGDIVVIQHVTPPQPPKSSAGAAETLEGLQFADAEEPARADERGVAENDAGPERDDLRR